MSMVTAVLGGLVGAVPGVLAVRRVRGLAAVQRRILDDVATPVREPQAAALTDEELAYLAGGPERTAQVELAALFLDDRIEGTDRGLRLVGGSGSAEDEPGPGTLRRTMVRQLAAVGTMPVRDLVVTGLAMDGGAETVAKGLRERGLCHPPEVLHRLRGVWAPARRRGYVIGGVLAALTVVGGILLFALAPDTLAAFVTAALATAAVGWLRAGVEASDAHARPTPRTPVGEAAVDAAAAQVAEEFNVRTRFGKLGDDERRVVLRAVAARGFGGLEDDAHDDTAFLEHGRRPGIRRSSLDLGYGLYQQVLSPFVTWCLFRNREERYDAASTHQAFDRAPTQELWDQDGASAQPVVAQGSMGNWRLKRLYRFRDTTVDEGW